MLLFETIDVSGNQLLSLCGVSQLCCVQRLLLDDNLIEELPLEMAELQQLRKLSLRNNSILVGSHSIMCVCVHVLYTVEPL